MAQIVPNTPTRFPASTTIAVHCRFGFVHYVAERDLARSNLPDTIADLIEGQFDRPVRVIACDPEEGFCIDISEDVALEIVELARREWFRLTDGVRDFVEAHAPSFAQAAE